MTQEDQDAIVGRIIRERKQLRAGLAAMEMEASKLGTLFQKLGELLRQRPYHIVFENQPVELEFQRKDVPVFKATEIDGNHLIALTTQIRSQMATLRDLENKARQLDIE